MYASSHFESLYMYHSTFVAIVKFCICIYFIGMELIFSGIMSCSFARYLGILNFASSADCIHVHVELVSVLLGCTYNKTGLFTKCQCYAIVLTGWLFP